jgi:hypothetical protein
MTPENESPSPSPGDRGVFGNLPSERPGVRSPRRTGEEGSPSAKPRQAKSSAAKPSSKASARSSPRPQPPKPSDPPAAERTKPPPSPPPSPEEDSSRKGIEEVAWAGVTVAAEAATLGVRLFSRALEAVRERR